jgi:nitrate reductase (NAD(P)H)
VGFYLLQDCWIVVKDMVYDVTKYLDSHPGGGDSILINGGMDSTEDFEAIHSQKAWGLLDEYYIGDLAQ